MKKILFFLGLFFLTSGYHVPYRNIAVFRSQKLHAVDNTPSQKVGNVNLFPGRAESKAQAVEPKSKNTESTIFDAILRAPEIQKVTKIVNDIKETPKKIERFGQSVVEVVEDVKSTPVKIQRAQQSVVKKVNDVKKNIDDTQAKVKDTIELVASAPTKIQTKVTEVKSTIDDTIEKTKYFANEVQKTPEKIRQAQKDTVEKVNQVKGAINSTQKEIKKFAAFFTDKKK